MLSQLKTKGLQDNVTFANLSVFSSIARSGNDWSTTGSDSVTGTGSNGPDIPTNQTHEVTTNTLDCALDNTKERISRRIRGGKIIYTALS